MYLIYFLLSLGALAIALLAKMSVGGIVFFLSAAAVFCVLGSMNLISVRLEKQKRNERFMISPEELRVFREQAEKAKQDKAAKQSVSP